MINKNINQKLNQELDQIKEQIINYFQPEKIILFGSLAKKEATLSSDIDLLIIKDSNLSFKERMYLIYDKIDYQVPLDMFFYTPEELNCLEKKSTFIKKIMQEGKIIYETVS